MLSAGLSAPDGSLVKFFSIMGTRLSYQELIALKEFHSLSHFNRELWNFDHRYNNWRKQEILGGMIPASVYHNEINFNKNRKYISSGQKHCQQNGH